MTLQRGFDLPKKERRDGQIPIISSSGAEDFHSVAAKQGPGVVTGRYGTIGKVYYSDAPYWPLNTTLFVSNFQGNNPKYCYYLLSQLNFHEHSGKTGVPGVNRNDLHTVEMLTTTDTEEQAAIAEALSDADALIEGLERLIAKKRLIKQGAMQDLLTAKRRLPGFSGEWIAEPIGNFCRAYSGGTPATTNASYYNGSIPWITSSDLNRPEIRSVPSNISDEGLEKSSAKIVPAETVLIALYGATAGVTSFTLISAAINQAVLALLPNNSCDRRFLFHSLRNSKSHMISTLTQGGQPNLSGALVKGYNLSMPSQKEEQTAIAAVLTDMDAEIQALDTRLEKARQVKEGMMQNLLTGRIRLV